MRLSPAHAVAALKTKRTAGPNGASPGLTAGVMHFLPLALASMIPGGAPTSLTEIRDRLNQRDDAIRARFASAAAGGAAPNATQQLQRDERELRAGSRASTRQAGMDLAREKFQSARDAFRSALSQARAGGQTQPSGNSAIPGASPTTPPVGTSGPDDHGSAVPAMPNGLKTDAAFRPLNPSPMNAGTAQQAAPSTPTPTQTTVPATAMLPPQMPPSAASGFAATQESASSAVKPVVAAGPPATAGSGSPAGDRSPIPPATNVGERTSKAPAGKPNPTAAEDADSAAPRENVDRILRVLRGQIHRSKSTTVIRMDPPELGYLRLQLDLHKDVMRLRIDADSEAARHLLSGELDALRQGLDAAGIRLESVEIRPLTLVDGSTAQQGQTSAWQDASAESHREAPRQSHPQPERPPAVTPESTDAVDAIGGLQAGFAKDSRVNLVV